MERLAIISVYDKSGLEPFAKALVSKGVKILSTGGTARYLQDVGIETMSISDYTGHPEIFDGRVKSLHPKIHGGILARRSNEQDLAEFDTLGILPIDFVVVNLYPFTYQVRDILRQGQTNHGSLVELIDIGGPTMLRAAAKNCHDVVPVCDPEDYKLILEELDSEGDVSVGIRRRLAAKVFSTMAAYDASVSRYFSLGENLFDEEGNAHLFAPVEGLTMARKDMLRYGENPHQKAAFYQEVRLEDDEDVVLWTQEQGKELSYNNILDMNGALELFLDLRRAFYLGAFVDGPSGKKHCSVVIKHSNPCGAALGETSREAFERARACDPLSAFGGIIAVTGKVDKELAECMLEGFLEVVLVEELTDEARTVFKGKKNVRVLLCNFDALDRQRRSSHISVRSMVDGYLLQTKDTEIRRLSVDQVVTGEVQSKTDLVDYQFAWIVAAHVKSNTIVVVKDAQAIGVGAGQMSRVDAAQLSLERAKSHGHEVNGAIAASDAFLPFPDTLEVLNDSGVMGLVQPGGSIKDEAVIESAKKRNVTMLFTGERHFRH